MADPALQSQPPQQGQQQPLQAEQISPELFNIAGQLPEDEQKKIAAQVIRDFDDDDRSRQEWLAMNAAWMRLFHQIDKPVSPPFAAGQYSEDSLPLLAMSCIQFSARAFRAMFPGRNIIKAIPTGQVDERSVERAERVGKHMNWQLLVQSKTYKRLKDALLLSVAVHGCMFTKTYRNPIERRNVVENVRAEDLVIPYGIGPRAIEDIERKTHIIWMSKNQTRILARDGYFTDEGEPWNNQSKPVTQDVAEKVEGLSQPMTQVDKPCRILEQHRVLDLDGDGIAEPYIVTVDHGSRKLLRVSIRYETDVEGNPTTAKRPVEYFTQYDFMPNPDGAYGLGMGHLVGKINAAINSLLRQMIDAGTLANVGNSSGFISSALGMGKGEVALELGKFKAINAGSDDLSRGIFKFDFPGPSQALGELLTLLKQEGERLGSATEALTGQTDTVQQPTTVLALIEQGLQVFSTVYERLNISLESELDKLYRLNRIYLDRKEYFTVLDFDGMKRMSVSPDDYADDLQIEPIVDPKHATEQQKIAQANLEWQFLSQNPLVVQNPIALYQASRRYMQAIGAQNIDQVLFNPAPPKFRVDNPAMENMAALMSVPIIPAVHADQNHLLHMKVHEGLFSDPEYGMRLTPNGATAMREHIQTHVAFLYGATEAPMLEALERGQGGSTTMGPSPGYGGIPGAAQGQVQSGNGMAQGGNMGADQSAQGPGGSAGVH